jgi:hypothetical protein
VDITKIEVVALVDQEAPNADVAELSDLQLSCVGGGIADPAWA